MFSDAQDVFDQIQLLIRQHNGEDLIKHLLIRLNQPGSTEIEEMRRYEPWNLLLLVKWATLYGDFSTAKSDQPVPDQIVHTLLKLMQALCDQVSAFETVAEVHLYMRKLAYQQFWLQAKESIPFGLAYQHLIFGTLPADHPFQIRFEAITGVGISEFIQLSFAILHYLLVENSRILLMKEWFFAEAQAYSWDTVERFLDSVSITTDDAGVWLAEHENDKSAAYSTISSEYFERTPFFRYPLFKHDGKYFVISPTLLLHSLSTYVHDELRRDDPQAFMKKYGNMFEKLLDRSLRSVGLNVLTEKDLERHFRHNSGQKVVDFLIAEDGCNIYVESKGVTMRWEGMVAQLPETLRRERSIRSILKAVRQAYDLSSRIHVGDRICGTEVGGVANFLLVVTMNDFFVGSGRDFREYIAKQKIDDIVADCGGKEHIPLQNIFFVSVNDLYLILGEIAHGSRTLSQLMKDAAAKVRTFGGYPVFRQLITEINGDIHPPPIIQQATDELLQQAADILNPYG